MVVPNFIIAAQHAIDYGCFPRIKHFDIRGHGELKSSRAAHSHPESKIQLLLQDRPSQQYHHCVFYENTFAESIIWRVPSWVLTTKLGVGCCIKIFPPVKNLDDGCSIEQMQLSTDTG